MTRLSKQLSLVLSMVLLSGCATSPAGGMQAGDAKMAAATCMSELDSARMACEQNCPTPTGNEHFSVAHKLARENIACKEQCAASREERAAQCTTAR